MTLFAETGWMSWLFLGALVVIVGVMLLRIQRYYRRHPSPAPSYSPQDRSDPPPRGLPFATPREMANWEVQMHELSRELIGQLTSKMALLEHLIQQADQAAARLEAALVAAETQQPRSGPAPRQKTEPPASTVFCRSATPPASQADALKPAGQRDTPVADSGAAEHPAEESPARGRRYEEIYTLADYGYDAAEIARRLGAPLGEIQLILNLRTKT